MADPVANSTIDRLKGPASLPVAPPLASSLPVAPPAGVPANAAKTGQVIPPKSRKPRRVLPLIVLAAIGFGAWKGYDWFTTGRFIVSTDDAYVKADMSVLAAKVAGYVATVEVADNTAVKAGDILARIDDGDYRLAVQAAQDKSATQDATIARIGQQMVAQNATIEQAKAMLVANRADAVRAQADFERATTLAQSDYGSRQRLDQTRADRDRTNATIRSAEATITGAEAQLGVLAAQKTEAERTGGELKTALARAQRDLDFTVVKAPFEGVVGNKAAQPGQYVQAGTRLMALVPMQSVYVEANFKETQLGKLRPGQKVDFSVDAYPGRTFEGEVESLAPASGAQFSLLPPENATGNFTKIVQRVPVRIRIPDGIAAQGLMRMGMSVVADVKTRDPREPKPTLMGALGFPREE